MLAVAWRRPRGWLLWSCTFQLAAVATHVAGALDREIRWVATATALNAWASLSLAALLWGAVEAHLRRRATAGSNAPDSAGESAHEAVA
jgi:hypothetical protein